MGDSKGKGKGNSSKEVEDLRAQLHKSTLRITDLEEEVLVGFRMVCRRSQYLISNFLRPAPTIGG